MQSGQSSTSPPGSRAASTKARREKILQATLRCLVGKGYTQTAVEDLRAGSGASIGSLYHHFGGKPEIAAALYVDGIERYQQAMIERLEEAKTFDVGIRGLVSEHVRWARENGDLARYLLTWPDREVLMASGRRTKAKSPVRPTF